MFTASIKFDVTKSGSFLKEADFECSFLINIVFNPDD
jgi:hypothetical protein